jgi:predicted neuraminidase
MQRGPSFLAGGQHRPLERISGVSRAFGSLLCLLIVGVLTGGDRSRADELRIEQTADVIAVRDDHGVLLEYRQTPNPYKVYVSSLTTPNGAQILRDSPHDHVHHHALMYAIGADGVDFWSEDPAAQPGKQLPRSTAARVKQNTQNGSCATIDQAVSWVDADGQAHLQETRALALWPEAIAGAHLLTWDSRFQPAADRDRVDLWGRHYFGLGMRFVTSMDQDGSLRNASGQPGESVRGTERLVAADWCAYTARVDGKPVTVAMFDHPQNAPHRATWFTMTGPFAYLAATLNLARTPIQLPAGQTLRLRYGVAAWDGEVQQDQIQQAFQAWVALERPAGSALPDVAQEGTDGYLAGQLIYPLDNKPTPQCHASTLAETPSGLVAAWFGGTREKHQDVGIWVARHVNGQWSTPEEVADGVQSDQLRYPCWNPVLFQPDGGPLLLFYKVGPSPSTWWGMLTTSDDAGRTWSEPRKLGQDPAIGHLLGPVKNKPIQLDDGGILCPSSTEHDGWRVHLELTRDLGQTWTVIGPINDGVEFGAIQPSILTYGDGRMQLLCRSRQQVIAHSWSADGGQTWSDMTATSLPNPNSGIDAVTLADGRQVLVYNHTTRGIIGFPSGRNMLNVAVSDNGRDWTPVLILERSAGEYSYPAVIQTADGHVHITYTYQRQSIKHVVLDPAAWP